MRNVTKISFEIFITLSLLIAVIYVLSAPALARQDAPLPGDDYENGGDENGEVDINELMRTIPRFLRGEVQVRYVSAAVSCFLKTDEDEDGIYGGWEGYYGLVPTLPEADGDPDGDGWNNLKEFIYRTDPSDHLSPGPLRVLYEEFLSTDINGLGSDEILEWIRRLEAEANSHLEDSLAPSVFGTIGSLYSRLGREEEAIAAFLRVKTYPQASFLEKVRAQEAASLIIAWLSDSLEKKMEIHNDLLEMIASVDLEQIPEGTSSEKMEKEALKRFLEWSNLARVQTRKASIYEFHGSYEEAVSEYEKALDHELSNKCPIYERLGYNHSQLGNNETALRYYRMVRDEAPDYHDMFYIKRLILQYNYGLRGGGTYKPGVPDDLAYYSEAEDLLGDYSDNPQAYQFESLLASQYYGKREYEKAIGHYQNILKNSYFWGDLGESYLGATVYGNLALAYEKTGQYEEAYQAIEEGRQTFGNLFPDWETYRQLLERLREALE